MPPLLVQQAKILVTKHRVLSEKSFLFWFSKLFNKELDPSDSGHSSMNSLLSSLASAKVLDLAYENFAMTIRPSKETLLETRGIMEEDCDLSDLDTLASRSVTQSNFLPPEDTVLRFVLPVEELPMRYKEGETFPVVVTHVESPSKFWFNLQQSGYLDRVNNIMDRMDVFYKGVKGDMYRLGSTSLLRPGNILAAEYRGQGFHRALVIKVINLNIVSLFYLDYGTRDSQKIKYCRYLHKDFSRLPGQAIQARLWGIKPIGGRNWDKGNKARDKMVELADTLEGCLVARIRAGVNKREVTLKGEDDLEEERSLALSLMDIIEGDEGQDVAEELVVGDLAEWELFDEEEDAVAILHISGLGTHHTQQKRHQHQEIHFKTSWG